jgi:hypothetical protein
MPTLEYLGKIVATTYKQIEHQRLKKSKVITTSELAKRKDEEAGRAQEFTGTTVYEEFVNGAERSASPNSAIFLGQRVEAITRESLKEQ